MLAETSPAAVRTPAPARQDTRLDVKVVLSGLWVAVLLVFVFVDLFGFWRADVVQGALDAEVPGQGLAIGQAFLVGALGYVLVPILMVVVSLTARAGVNRWANLVTSLAYAVSIAALAIGEEWVYYVVGSVVEVLLLLVVARTAWSWPSASGTPEQVTRAA